jgi:hypothetical protein
MEGPLILKEDLMRILTLAVATALILTTATASELHSQHFTADAVGTLLRTALGGSLPGPQPPDAEPQFEGVFMWLDPNTGALAKLERQLPRVRGSTNLLIGGAKVEGEFAGGRSPVRVPSEPLPVFVVKVQSRTSDPYGALQFFRLDQRGNRRVITLLSRSGWDGSVTVGYDDRALVSFDVALHGSSSYRLTPTAPLEAGEYCLGLTSTEHGYCFGVDAPKRP